MTLDLPKDPSLKDFQLAWEAQYWDKARNTRKLTTKAYEQFLQFFGEDRRPRNIFRADVEAYKVWMKKKGYADSSIRVRCDNGSRLFNLLGELELVEKGFNPFKEAGCRTVVILPR